MDLGASRGHRDGDLIGWLGTVWIAGLVLLRANLSTVQCTSGTMAIQLRRGLGVRPLRRALIAGMVLFAFDRLLGVETWRAQTQWDCVADAPVKNRLSCCP